MSRHVFVRIVDYPELQDVLDVETILNCTEADLILDLSEAWRHVLPITPSRHWDFCFEDQSIKGNRNAFVNALDRHTYNNPILVHVHPIAIERILSDSEQTRKTNSRQTRRQLSKVLEIRGSSHRRVHYDTPYNHDIKFGHYVPPRDGFPMDDIIIDLKDFDIRYQTEFGARLIAYLYAVLFYEGAPIDVIDDLQRPIHQIGAKRSFSSLMTRANIENVVNLITALTQQGKSIEIVLCAVFNLFLGKDSFVFLRDIGGNAAKENFRNDLQELTTAFVDYCETVLHLDIGYYEDILTSISVYEGSNFKPEKIRRPFIYCERLNESKIILPFSRIYQSSGRNMYSLFIDEEDEKRLSIDATIGKCENTMYNRSQDAIGCNVYHGAFMTIGFSGTLCPILTSKPASNEENYRFRVVELPIPADYKGYHHTLPEERRIIRIVTPPKRDMDKSIVDPLQRIYYANPGIKDMLQMMVDNHASDEYPYVSGLISCSSLTTNAMKEELAKGLVSDHPNKPVVSFADCQSKEITLWCNTNQFFPSVTQFQLQHRIDEHFGRDRKTKVICTRTTEGFDLHFKKKEQKTVRAIYDIIRLVYELEDALQPKPFVISTTFALGNRGATYKPSDHSMPLNHQYASEKTPNFTNAVDVKQIAGRLCSRDRYTFKRYLFATAIFLDHLERANRIDIDLCNLFSGHPKTYDEAFTDIDPNLEIGKLIYYLKTQLMKKRMHEEIVPDLKSKIRRLEEHHYTETRYVAPPTPPSSDDDSDLDFPTDEENNANVFDPESFIVDRLKILQKPVSTEELVNHAVEDDRLDDHSTDTIRRYLTLRPRSDRLRYETKIGTDILYVGLQTWAEFIWVDIIRNVYSAPESDRHEIALLRLLKREDMRGSFHSGQVILEKFRSLNLHHVDDHPETDSWDHYITTEGSGNYASRITTELGRMHLKGLVNKREEGRNVFYGYMQ